MINPNVREIDGYRAAARALYLRQSSLGRVSDEVARWRGAVR